MQKKLILNSQSHSLVIVCYKTNDMHTHVSFGIKIIRRHVVDHHVEQRGIEKDRFWFYRARLDLFGAHGKRLQIVIRAIAVATTVDVTAEVLRVCVKITY